MQAGGSIAAIRQPDRLTAANGQSRPGGGIVQAHIWGGSTDRCSPPRERRDWSSHDLRTLPALTRRATRRPALLLLVQRLLHFAEEHLVLRRIAEGRGRGVAGALRRVLLQHLV